MNRLKLDPIRHLAVPMALLATVAVALLAQTLPLGGRAPQELVAIYGNLFTPATYALSIWWVIFSGLAAFTLYQILPSQADDPAVKRVGNLFLVASLLYIGWRFAWHFMWTGLSVLLMALLTAAVLLIYLQVTRRRKERTTTHRLMVALPFRIYLGWLTVALMTNVMAWFTDRESSFAPLGELGWSLVLVAAIVLIGTLMLWINRDLFFNLALIWGLVAIAVGQSGEPAMLIASLLGAVLLLALIVLQVLRSRRRAQPAPVVEQSAMPERRR